MSDTVLVTTAPCMLCGKESTRHVDAAAFRAWRGGMLIQQAFPDMSDPERELLKSGTHPKCWDQMFGSLDDEEDES